MSGGSSSGKGFGSGKGKWGRKGPPVVWDGPLDPDFFLEPIFEFLAQNKREFTRETPLRWYDNRKEEWPKCRQGLLSADMHRWDVWRSPFLQMSARLGYY